MEEEDPESQGAAGKGDNWVLFVELAQAVWTHGSIPCKLLWSTVVLIPKGGGDYCGIGLLEPIWKRHFLDVHTLDSVKVLKEGKFRRCRRCGMEVDPRYTGHQYTKECQMEVEWKKQREAVVTSALALRPQFSVHEDVLEQVEVFKYLGHLLAQDDDDIRAIRVQLRKARATWAHVGQVLRAENVPPCITAEFYKMVVKAVLLYGSKMWVLLATALVSLEGFHIHAAYQMVVRHKPRRGPGHGWINPKSKDMLKECGMSTLAEYITVRRQTIVVNVGTHPVLWEQQMDLDVNDAIGSDE